MRFDNGQHRFYAGIDVHARFMHVCILDAAGRVVYDHNLACDFPTLVHVIAPYREDLVVGAEGMFGWYWLADRCAEVNIPFGLGHALYMKLIPERFTNPSVQMSVTADLDLIDEERFWGSQVEVAEPAPRTKKAAKSRKKAS